MQQEANSQVPYDTLQLKKPQSLAKPSQMKYNQYLYHLFVRREFGECMKLVQFIQKEFGESHEFSNFIKGLTLRMQGNITQSVENLKRCLVMNDKNIEVLKYICKNLFFLGRYKASIEVAHDALRLGEDWEIYFTMGQCFLSLKDIQRSLSHFSKAYELSKNEQTFLQMGKMLTITENYKEAIKVYLQGLQFSVQNTEIMTILGILFLRIGENQEAMKYLEQAACIDASDPRNLLGLASILQDKSEYDASLSRYRQLLVLNPNSSQVWNNVGMCFYGKKKYIAAISCLKKALYFDPFEWIIHFNLGLVHLTTQQYSSAFHFFSSAIQLKADFAQSYMYLAIALNYLDDFTNCCRAMDIALELEKDKDYLIYLNYCLILLQRGQKDQKVKDYFHQFEVLFQKIDVDTRCNQDDILTQRQNISQLLGIQAYPQ